MSIQIKRKTSGVGAPSTLLWGQPAVDTDGNFYIGNSSNQPIQIAQRASFIVVANDSERNAISPNNRREGMIVSVISSASNSNNPTLYRLEGGILNTNWVVFSGSGSGTGSVITYSTEAELLSDTPTVDTIALAEDTSNVFFYSTSLSSWVAVSGGSGNLGLPVGWTAQVYGVPNNIAPTSVMLRVSNPVGDFEVELSLIPTPPVADPDFTIDFETDW